MTLIGRSTNIITGNNVNLDYSTNLIDCESPSLDFITRIMKGIEDRNYAKVPIRIPKKNLQEAEDAFVDIIKSIDLEKLREISTKISPARNEVGFFIRRIELKDDDDKTWFHYHPKLAELLQEKKSLLTKSEHSKLVNFSGISTKIYWEMLHYTVKPIMILMDRYFQENYNTENGKIYEKFFSNGIPQYFIRFLFYEAKVTDAVLGKPHFDRGAFTFTIHESHEGLRISPTNDHNEFYDVRYRENEGNLFIGNAAQDVLPPSYPYRNNRTLHEILRKFENTEERKSIVSFLWPQTLSDDYLAKFLNKEIQTDLFTSFEKKEAYKPKPSIGTI